MTVGKRLKELRYKLGLSQREFAEKLGIHYMTLSRYESGKYSLSDRFITKLKETFKVNPRWLLTGEGEMFLPKDKPTEALKVEAFGLKGATIDFLAEEIAEKAIAEAMVERGILATDSVNLYPFLKDYAKEKVKAFYQSLKAEIGYQLDTLERFIPSPKPKGN